MESDDFTRHYIIRYLSAHELVLPPLLTEYLTEYLTCTVVIVHSKNIGS